MSHCLKALWLEGDSYISYQLHIVQILWLENHWVCVTAQLALAVKLFDSSACPTGSTKYLSTPRGEVLAKLPATLPSIGLTVKSL